MKIVIVDSDALIALINKDDALAEKSLATLENLFKLEARLLYPATTIVETTTALQRKLSNPKLSAEIANMVKDSRFEIVPVDRNIIEIAATIFNPSGSKQNTMFDAVVAAVAKTLEADAVFGFDRWYKKIGLTLASDLTTTHR